FLFSAACAREPTPTPTVDLSPALGTLASPHLSIYDADWNQVEQNEEAMWDGNPSLATTVYAAGFSPSSPYGTWFGSTNLTKTVQALQNAIPDLKLRWRMRAHEHDWAAWAFELSGTFSGPLSVKSGKLTPTNQPFFTVIQMMVHANTDDQIDQEYSAADTP